jgi:hypothetical protein
MYQVVPGPVGAAAETVIEAEADLVWAGLLLSFTVAVKLEVPVAVGVPEMVPVVAARLSPAGRLPELIDHVYEGLPPAAVIGAE